MEVADEIYHSLRKTSKECLERGLVASAKWAAEALLALTAERKETKAVISKFELEPMDDIYLLGKAYFDAKEYVRAAFVLEDCHLNKGVFLKYYSRYLAVQREEEEINSVLLGENTSSTENKALAKLCQELHDIYKNGTDAYITYLYGVTLNQQRREEACEILIDAVNKNPYIWSAWQELGSSIDTIEGLSRLTPRLPLHCMTQFFLVHVSLELHQTTDEISNMIAQLERIFPKSANLKSKKALLAYDMRDFEEAESIFDEILKDDPYRLDDMDVFSNILYVMEKRTKLSNIAHAASSIDRYRPETCCAIGNYYSLRSDHEKAILYFKRALRFNRNFLSAWTLMGHEYIELKNTHAAIQAYRRAVDVNRKDYRAWYGLGQTYELLEMRQYALYYYQRAAALRAYDSRMWQALGLCYEHLDRIEEAIKCFKRALLGNSIELHVYFRLASLYDRIGNRDSAAYYHGQCVQIGKRDIVNTGSGDVEGNNGNIEDMDIEGDGSAVINAAFVGRSCMFLAQYEMDRKQYAAAEHYLKEAEGYYSLREEARAVLRDLQSRKNA